MKSLITFIIIAIFSLAACSRGVDTFDDRVAKAEAHIGLGNYLAALIEYKSLIENYSDDPRRAGILLKVADLHSTGLGDSDEALKVYGRVISEEPLSMAARLARERRAKLRERQGNYEGAIEDYSALLKLFAKDDRSQIHRINVAAVYLSMRDYRQARVELKPLFKDKKISKEVLEKAIFLAAESYFLDGKSRKASGYFRWLLEEFPKSELAPEAKIHLATCYEEMGFLGVAGFVTKSVKDEYPNQKVVEARMKSLKDRGKSPVGKGKFRSRAKAKASEAQISEADTNDSKEPEKTKGTTENSLQSKSAPLASPRS